MSVINQVLSQLERRGVQVEQEQGLVRAVPSHRPVRALPLLLVTLLGAGAAWWWLERSTVVDAKPAAVRVAPAQPISILPASGVVAVDVIASLSGVPSSVPAVVPVSAVQEIQPLSSVARAESRQVPRRRPTEVQEKATQQPAAIVAPITGSVLKRDAGSDSAKLAAVDTPPPGGMPMKQVSRSQQADAEFRRGIELMLRGRSREAIESYQAALQLDGAHDAARQALVALLLEEKRSSDAEQLLQSRLDERPQHTGFAMLLARMQVERGETGGALATLERSLPYAGNKAEYLAFLAAMQQRSNRFVEAAANYLAALQLQPGNGVWLMGYGISLQAMQRTEEARVAYQQALDSKTLSQELQAFVQRKLKEL